MSGIVTELAKSKNKAEELQNKLNEKSKECERIRSEYQMQKERNRQLTEEKKHKNNSEKVTNPDKNKVNASNTKTSVRKPQKEPKLKHDECLLIGDDTISNSDRLLPEGVKLITSAKADIKNTQDELNLLYIEGHSYGRVILHTGTLDCQEHDNTDLMTADYKLLIKAGKQLSRGNVAVSSICPRNDEHDTTVQDLNVRLQLLAESEKCQYIKHDLNFRYVNGNPDTTVFSGRSNKLNVTGVKRLLYNYDIPIIEKNKNIEVDVSQEKANQNRKETQHRMKQVHVSNNRRQSQYDSDNYQKGRNERRHDYRRNHSYRPHTSEHRLK